MKRNRLAILDPVWIGASTVLAIAVMANFAWAQLIPPVPAVPDVVKDATNTAQDAVQDATNTAQDAAKNAQDTAKDVQRDATKTTQDVTRDAQNAARDAQNDAAKAARDAGKNARDTTRDATRNARDAARDATRNVPGSIDARAGARTQGSASVSGRGDFRGADLGIWFDRASSNGLIVADIAANAALSSAGFQEGDRIVSIAGRNVATEADFVRYLLNNNARGRMNVIVLRDGQQQTLLVDPAGLNQRMTTMQIEPLEQFGIIPDDRFNDRIVVWRVTPRSPAYYSGIRAGDVITSFANRPVANLAALAQLALQTRAGTIPVQVTRNGRTRVIEADFPDVQASGPHTTFRQNLDADVNAQSNIDVGARLQDQQTTGRTNANVRSDLTTDLGVPTVQTQSSTRYDYNTDRRTSRRAWRRSR